MKKIRRVKYGDAILSKRMECITLGMGMTVGAVSSASEHSVWQKES